MTVLPPGPLLYQFYCVNVTLDGLTLVHFRSKDTAAATRLVTATPGDLGHRLGSVPSASTTPAGRSLLWDSEGRATAGPFARS
jgi:hypothetical protein